MRSEDRGRGQTQPESHPAAGRSKVKPSSLSRLEWRRSKTGRRASCGTAAKVGARDKSVA